MFASYYLALGENTQTGFLYKTPLKSIPHNAIIENPKSKAIQEIAHLSADKKQTTQNPQAGQLAANCNFACWWRCPQSPGSQSKLCGLFSIKKTETSQFLVNYHSSFIRFSGSAASPAMCSRGLGRFPSKRLCITYALLAGFKFSEKVTQNDVAIPCGYRGVYRSLGSIPESRDVSYRRYAPHRRIPCFHFCVVPCHSSRDE